MTKRKINLSRLIISNLHYFLNPAPRGITWAHVFLLLLSPAYHYANAQPSTEPPDYQYGLESNLNPSMAIIIVVLMCAFFTLGFFSIYVGHCSDSRAATVVPRSATESHSRLRGLDPTIIETFPIFVYSEVKDLKIGKGALECAVCLSEFEDDETLRLLPECDHVFHPDCIDPWLASHTTCPVCRANLNPEFNKLAGDSPQATESNDERSIPQLDGVQNEVLIDVNEDRSRDSQVFEIANRTPRKEISGKFPRSHSTGHSLLQPGNNTERYTLRLPEEIRKQIMLTEKLKRTASFNVVFERGWSWRKGYRSGDEGSSRAKSYLDRVVGRSDRWVFSMTPPFLSWVGSVKSLKSSGDGDGGNGKTDLTSVKVPLDCVNVKVEGVEESSVRPPV